MAVLPLFREPPSFAAHRRTLTSDNMTRSAPPPQPPSPTVYTIPQRQSLPTAAPPPTPSTAKPIPQPSTKASRPSHSPQTSTSPPGRLAYAAAARGISLDLRSPRSPNSPNSATSPRQRGLTVGVLKGATLVAESAPTTPLPPTPRRGKDIILCRYYHTPGMTCTSSPCRFVHNIDALALEAGPASPFVLDQTSGTFALAQITAPSPLVTFDIVPGETVAVVDESGLVSASAFKMSGGGKGPAGKCKAKFKTVPCKDFKDGQCAYGDYCSFIHDVDNLYDEEKHGKKEKEKPKDKPETLKPPPKSPRPRREKPSFPTTPPSRMDMSISPMSMSMSMSMDISPHSTLSPIDMSHEIPEMSSWDGFRPYEYYQPQYQQFHFGLYDYPVSAPPGLPLAPAPPYAQYWDKRSYYRTRPCRLYAQGHCPHGDHCTYLHFTRADLKRDPSLKRTIPCKWFSNGGCNIANCAYAHIPPDEMPKPFRTRPCRHFAVGRCHLGDQCNFSHEMGVNGGDGVGRGMRGNGRSVSAGVYGGGVGGVGGMGMVNEGLKGNGVQVRTEEAGETEAQHAEIVHEGAYALTEERLAAACADLRAKIAATVESDGESDCDDVEIVTVATGSGSLHSVKGGAVSV